MKILIINGPNLNMLGKREAGHYGTKTLDEVNALISEEAKGKADVEFFQSNHEGDIVDRIQQNDFDHIIINAGAYTHTSIAIRDALLSVKASFVEVHLSNVYAREEFRYKSYLSDIAAGVIAGCGYMSYLLALKYLLEKEV